MTWTPEITTVNQRIQIGAEATSALGTAVAASKILECFDWTIGIDGDVLFYRPTGRKYASTQEQNTEYTTGTLAGEMDYNGVIYPLGGVMGSVTSVAHLASTTAKDWIFSPPLTGSVVPQTYTLQQGDSTRARQVAYLLFQQFGYKAERKTGMQISGKWMAQPLTDNATLTTNPTTIAIAPIVGKQINVYLDPTSAALGTTQLNKVLAIDYTFDSVYNPFFPLNRSNLGWTAHVDMPPTCTIKLLMEADTAGMAPLSYLEAGTTYFLRVSCQGAQIASDGPGAIYNTFQHDMAIKFNKPSPFQDKDGVFALEWQCQIVEDPTWAKSQTITVTNLLTAL